MRTIIDRSKDTLFTYVCNSDDSIILFSINILSAEETEYLIERINISSYEVKELVKKTAYLDEKTSSGEYISCIDVCNNFIYAYGGISGQCDSVTEYNLNGRLNNRWELKDMESFLSSDHVQEGFKDGVWSMHVNESYVVLHTLNQRSIMFRMSDSGLDKMEIPDELYKDIPGEFQFVEIPSGERGLIYFAACYSDTNNLYVFDVVKKIFSAYTMPSGNKNGRMPVSTTNDGNIIMRDIDFSHGSTMYILNADDIKQ